jgi:ribosomal protein S18 acetylase RimI-like enzyme
MSVSRGATGDDLILPAGPADAEDVARVHVRSWRETYKGLLPDAYLARMSEPDFARRFRKSLTFPRAHEATLIVLGPQGIVAYAQAGPSRRRREGEAEIATIYVLRHAQRQGVGRRLLAASARAMAAQGAKSLLISVLKDNLPARAFYERLGGVAEEPRREPGPGGVLLMEVAYRWPDIGDLIP